MNSPFDLVDILNPQGGREGLKRMSVDYPSSNPSSANGTHGAYGDFDHSLSSLHGGHPGQSQSNGNGQQQQSQNQYDHAGDSMDLSSSDPNSYDFSSPFSSNGPSSNPFGSSRYRTNASSSSSLGQGFGGLSGADGLYSHGQSPFADFSSAQSGGPGPGTHAFDLVSGLSSSYSSGKVSPLTPSDPVVGLHGGPNGFPGQIGKSEYGAGGGYPDLIGDGGRRASNVSTGSFQSDFHDEFGIGNGAGMVGMGGAGNGGLGLGGFPPPHAFDRLGRFDPSPTSHYSAHSPGGGPTSVPSQLHHRSSLDMLRGVNPHEFSADMNSPFTPMAPPGDLALRIPGQNMSVDETLSRMKLQAHVGMGGAGAATDLQSFIR